MLHPNHKDELCPKLSAILFLVIIITYGLVNTIYSSGIVQIYSQFIYLDGQIISNVKQNKYINSEYEKTQLTTKYKIYDHFSNTTSCDQITWININQ
jgi:hypothetical protein